jgi:translation initiation factor 5
MRHKLVTYILKNPPKKREKGKKGKKGGMTAEAIIGGPMVFDKAEDGSGEDDVDGSPVTSPGNRGVSTSGTDIDAILGKSDPVIENPETAEDVANKLNGLKVNGSGAASGNGNGHGPADDEDDDEAADSPYSVLGSWLEENRLASDTEVIAQIKELEIVGKHKVLIEIGQKLFADDVANELPKRTVMLQAVRPLSLNPLLDSADTP